MLLRGFFSSGLNYWADWLDVQVNLNALQGFEWGRKRNILCFRATDKPPPVHYVWIQNRRSFKRSQTTEKKEKEGPLMPSVKRRKKLPISQKRRLNWDCLNINFMHLVYFQLQMGSIEQWHTDWQVTDKGRQWSDSDLKFFLSNPLYVKRDVKLRGRSNGHEVCLISFYGLGKRGGLSGFWVAFWWVTFGQSKFPGLNMFGKRYLWNRDSDHDVESIH